MIVLKENKPVLIVDQNEGIGGLLVGKVEYGSVGLLKGLYVVKEEIFHL